MKNIFLILLLFCGVDQVNAQQQKTEPSKKENSFPEASSFSNTKMTYKIINAPNHTFCYDIFSDDRLVIHQPSIPGMQGNSGFKTKQDAEKVAKLVIEKINNGEMPPTVTMDEMKKLKVIP